MCRKNCRCFIKYWFVRKNITIISSVIFPRISPRSMRATELAKELARQGHNVTLYGVLGQFDYKEFEEKYEIKVKDLGPVNFVQLNSDGESEMTILYRVFRKLFKKLLEFPDIELAFRTNKVLKTESNTDLLITIAVPFPIHWGAAFSKSRNIDKFAKIWVADCGDPYMGNKLHKRPFYFKYIEKWFCKKADYISIPIEEAKEAYYPEFHNKIRVIPQGFDFGNNLNLGYKPNNKVLTFIYAGVFYSGIRDPRPFLDYLVSKKDTDFLFVIYTKSEDILAPYKRTLGNKIIVKNYIPREELLIEMAKADFLVNFENNTSIQSPSKLIDYALSHRPILSLNSSDKLNKEIIEEFFMRNYNNSLVIKDIERYNIKTVAKQFVDLLD